MDLPHFNQQPFNNSLPPQNNQGLGDWNQAGALGGSSSLSLQNHPQYPPGPTATPMANSSTFPDARNLLGTSFQQGQALQAGDKIEDYLHVPCVRKVHEGYFSLAGSVSQLVEENRVLREALARLNGINDTPLHGQPNNPTYQHVSGSLAPSDSISQRARQSSTSFESASAVNSSHSGISNLRIPVSQPANRPDHLPFEILWSKDDCKLDEFGAKPLANNDGRPRMQNAIREKDGTPISKTNFKAIQLSVAKQAGHLIHDEEERLRRRLGPEQMKKAYFERFRPKHWWHAVAVIEADHPILTYAASHWKTVQLLTNRLTSLRNQNAKKAGHRSKKVKRSAKSKRTIGDIGASDSTSSSNENGDNKSEDDGDGDEDVPTGSKRKRSSGSNESDESSPNGPPSSRPSGSVIQTDMDVDTIDDFEHPIPVPSKVQKPRSKVSLARSMAEKRLGKQAMFAAASAAALQIGTPGSKPTQPSADTIPTIEPIAPRPPRASVLSLITVDATHDGVQDALSTTFHDNMPPHAIELLEALEKISSSMALNSGSPSSAALQFIERVESADPTMPDIDEDDTNIGWGHLQFTSGGITCRTVIKTWSDIGNVKTAYRLLAASLKTCLVARHLCFANKIPVSASSYLSDAYLREVVEILWNIRAQDSVSSPPTAPKHASATTSETMASSSKQISEPASAASHVPNPTEKMKHLERLHIDELKTWASDHSIPFPAHNKRKKNDWIATIIRAGGEKIPTEADVLKIISQRTSSKNPPAAAAKPN